MKKSITWLLSLLVVLFAERAALSYELGIATLFRNEANYLAEWVEYHHLLGVDHFLLYNDRSDDHWEEVLKPYIDRGLVEVVSWDKDLEMNLFPDWQLTAYKDALWRSKGNTKWLAFIDIDEFIVPLNKPTITKCLNHHFSKASAVYACWRNFGTNGVYVPLGDPIITQLTACSPRLHPMNAMGKSIVKVDDVAIDLVGSAHYLTLNEGARYYNGSGKRLFFKENVLQVDPQHQARYIRVNHYKLRDEYFFHNVRMPKAISKIYGEVHLLEEHYEAFNQCQDETIINFLKRFHPKKFREFWHED